MVMVEVFEFPKLSVAVTANTDEEPFRLPLQPLLQARVFEPFGYEQC
jgi:hypothetical protein